MFLLSGSILIEGIECRGTKPDARQLLSPVTKVGYGLLVQCRGTRLNPRRLLSPVTEVSFGQWRESGFIRNYLFIKVQKAPQKP